MIAISTIEQNENGAVVLDRVQIPDTIRRTGTARVQRAATLDGGVVINHFGFSHGDRTIRISGHVDQAVADALWDIFTSGEMVNVSTEDGFWRAAIESMEEDDGDLDMTIWIKEALHAT